MTPEERVRAAFAAWEALAVPAADYEPGRGRLVELLADAIREAVAAERERCAKQLEAMAAAELASEPVCDADGWEVAQEWAGAFDEAARRIREGT